MGRHRAGIAVFVDDSGRRATLVGWAMYAAAAVVVLGLAVVVVSLLGGVPMPGLSSPVTLPKAEHAVPRNSRPSPVGTTFANSASAAGSAASPGVSATVGTVADPSPSVSPAATIALSSNPARGSADPSARPSATPTPTNGRPSTTARPGHSGHGKPSSTPSHP